MPQRVAVLMHQHTHPPELKRWSIFKLAQYWREEGIEVKYLFGPGARCQSDVLIVHVDMSVVPDEYLEAAGMHPVCVNGKVKDIRKSTFSRLLVKPEDSYAGPVIVKSDFNCAGVYELKLATRQGMQDSAIPRHPFHLQRQSDYRIYEFKEHVPGEFFSDTSLVVEQFLPEREDDIYFTRNYYFFGTQSTTIRLGSRMPIVTGRTKCVMQEIEPHPEVVEFRKLFHLDYGKIDYVVHDGHAKIFDVNKTTGDAGVSTEEMLRHRARGIYDYLRQA